MQPGADTPTTPRVAVVGGGLVGSLNACYLARRGFHVDVYEYRADIRRARHVQGKSINLALSHRGRRALAGVGVEQHVTGIGIPMYARMIHDVDGRRRAIPYGTRDQYIMSIDRRKLNECLLSLAQSMPNVTLHFEHKLVSCDPGTGSLSFTNSGGVELVERSADVIMGNDGAYSTVRMQAMKHVLRFDYSQSYIPHGYKELCMPPTASGGYAMEVNYLHIWPRGQFMMIALPNLDKTYTVTLFMPFHIFDSIGSREDLLDFFNKYFPDALPLLGEDKLVTDYISVKAQPLVTVKCDPYHVDDKVLLMGDAAHAMVPFYGQGMNAGFEDCLILDDILEQCKNDFAQALPKFTAYRSVDAHAICDLALYNYVEMRDLVNSPRFLLRKKLDNLLHWVFPRAWVPLYTSVSFTRIRYHECVENRRWQDKVLSRIIATTVTLTGLSLLSLAALMFVRRRGHLLADRLIHVLRAYRDSGEYYFAPHGSIITSTLERNTTLMK